jgi:hypothetical protein
MSQEHVNDLRKARSALVNSRRDWTRVLAGGYQRGKTEEAIKAIVDIQHAIDAVDNAERDEGDLISKGQ